MIINEFGTIEDIHEAEIDCPTVGSSDILVKVRAAAVNPADIKSITGKDGGKFIRSGEKPIRPGFDFSGTVEETGRDAAGFAVGDDVFGFLPYSTRTTQGSFAEFVVVQDGSIAKKPSSVSHIEAAAAATTGSTALQSLVDIAGITKGQKVLINGASGGVGCFAVQIARSYGAAVWGTCSESSVDFVRSLGAVNAIDYRKNTLTEMTEQFDIILDAVSNSSFGECSGIMAPKGVYITLLPLPGFFIGKIRSLFSSRKCSACIVKPKSADLEKLAEMMETKNLTSPVAATFPLTDLKDAFKRFAAGGIQGKIAIAVDIS